MSRIGKKPIDIPQGVKVQTSGNVVQVEGPKGTLKQEMKEEVKLAVEEDKVILERASEQKKDRALHGLYRSLIANMIQGVTEGYKVSLELIGVGFKAENKGNILNLNLGYSHLIWFQVPEGLSVSTEMKKGQNPTIHLEGIDKQLVGHVAAQLKSLRKTEPYKGKGVRVVGEHVRKKAGKQASK